MLEYRLETLWDVVDFFVLVESRYTFSGKPKKLYTSENMNALMKYKSKIVHIVLSDCPYKYPNINYANNQQWMNEFYQRDGIIKGLQSIPSLNDDTCILISDVDEIPDRETLKKIKNREITIENGIQSLEQDMYYYNLNNKLEDKWYSSKILTYTKFIDMYNKYTNMKYFIHFVRLNNKCKPLERGGWHLSYFGDEHFIKNKIENFSHQELNTHENTNLETIRTKMKETNITLEENSYLPCDYANYFL